MTDDNYDQNPYDAAIPPTDPSAPTQHQVIEEACRHASLLLRVCVPARVHAVLSNQRVALQPLMQSRYVGGVTAPLPIIPQAHVVLLHGTTWGVMRAPLAIGDLGIAIFCDRSLAPWAASDGTTALDPADNRAHNLSDAFFLPGAVPNALESAETKDLVLQNQAAQIRLGIAGFRLTNGQEELVTLVQQIAAQVQSLAGAVSALTASGNSVDPPSKASLAAQAAAAGALAARVATLLAP